MDKKQDPAQPVGAVIAHKLPLTFQIAFKLARMEGDWAELVGPPVAARTQPARIEHSCLIVNCTTPAAAQLIQMSAGTIIRRIERRYGISLEGVKPVVHRIEKPQRTSETKPRPLVVPRKLVEETYERISQTVRNHDTALALARLEAAAKTRFGSGTKDDGNNGKT